MAMPSTFWPTITFIALIAALASMLTLTTLTFTLPSCFGVVTRAVGLVDEVLLVALLLNQRDRQLIARRPHWQHANCRPDDSGEQRRHLTFVSCRSCVPYHASSQFIWLRRLFGCEPSRG